MAAAAAATSWEKLTQASHLKLVSMFTMTCAKAPRVEVGEVNFLCLRNNVDIPLLNKQNIGICFSSAPFGSVVLKEKISNNNNKVEMS